MLIKSNLYRVQLAVLILFLLIPMQASADVVLIDSPPPEIPEELTIPKSIYTELNKTQSYLDFPLRIAQISDIHHYSSELYDADSPVFEQFSFNNEGRTVLYTKDILYALKNELIKKDIDILLVTGDLSVLGAESTHWAVADIFSDFEAAGINVFITTGNHDLNNPRTFGITMEGTEPADTVSPEKFRSIYTDFGYSDAVMVHDETLSYLAELDEDHLLLALDTSYYQDNFWLDYSAAPGIILPSLYDFTSEAISYAEGQDMQIIVMSHHNFLEHYEIDFDLSTFMVHEPQAMLDLLSKGGVRLAISGHIHKSDVKSADVSGNTFYGASLNALAQYPHSYRLLGLGESSAGITDYSLAYEPGSGLSKTILAYNWYIYYRRNLIGQYNRLTGSHSPEDSYAMAEYFYLANLYSQQGLEEHLPDKILKSEGARLYSESNSFMKGFAGALPIDSYPSDSDVRIQW